MYPEIECIPTAPCRQIPPGIILVIGQDFFDRVDRDCPPTRLDESPDTVQSGTRIRQESGFVTGERGGQVVVGVQADVRMGVPVPGYPLGPDLHGIDVSLSVA